MRKVIGFHSCLEVLRVRPRAIAAILVREGWAEAQGESSEFLKLVKNYRVPLRNVSPKVLDQVGEGHQGVAMEVREAPELDFGKIGEKESSLLLALDGITDPQNLGAMLRTSWLLGSDGILLPKSRSVGLTPAASKVASGGAEHVPLWVDSSLSSPLSSLKDKGFWVFGLSEKGTRSLWDLRIPEKIVWAVGSEGEGLRAQTLKFCDELVRIPQMSESASLNAATSAALAMGETQRQWSLSGKPEMPKISNKKVNRNL